jgi:nitrite reductase (NADH) small subunit/3-phenylpropionate/trans-cinnamate dioxygenase ferredoxin subunit
MDWIVVCKVTDLKEGEGKFVEAGGVQVAVFLSKGQVHVFDDHCPHAGASLSGGYLEEGHVVCPWHYWSFNLQTGKLAPSGQAGIHIYPCRLSGDVVEAQLPAPLPQAAAQMLDLEPPES